jgi:transcription elongation GreA/GreB family factor
MIKQKIYKYLHDLIDRRMNTFQSAALSAEESKNNETKSSAGDKYETARAMMQIEQEKNEMQWKQAKQLKQILGQIDILVVHEQVSLGSLVTTSQGVYFIAIGVGKVKLDDEIYYCISTDSPIGALLIGSSKGDVIKFGGRKIEIIKIE